MDMQDITAKLRAKMGADSGLNAVLKIDCGPDGVIVLDGTTVPNTVSNEDRAADCTIHVSKESLLALMSRQLNPMTGFLTGKIKVSGDMGVAMKLQRVM